MLGLEKLFGNSKYDALPSKILKQYNESRPLGPQKYPCHAPFKNIYFGHHGKAIACCYNRLYELGEYPKQSIKEIWFGDKANELRDHIKHNDFSLGCGACEDQLLAHNFDAVKAKQYDEREFNKNGYPSVMEFELSNTCNLECEMCSGDFSSLIRAKREKLPPIKDCYDANFVKQLEEFIPYLEEVKFYGGEPFLIDIYYDIWEKIKEINPSVRISVQTNATVLNNRVKEVMANTNFHLNISFDSLVKETYESIRRNADFERVYDNIQYFYNYCKAKNTFFGISVCAMRQNWMELPSFIEFCNKMEVPVYFHTVFFPKHVSLRTMKSDELKVVIDTLSQHTFEIKSAVHKKNAKHYSDLVNQLISWNELSYDVLGKKLGSFGELTNILTEHVKNSRKYEPSKKAKKIERITGKMAEIEQRLEPDLMQMALPLIDIDDFKSLDNMVGYLDKLPVSALMVMVRTGLKQVAK
jgi:MoaA/NifB/PqqE/SkfB family radical SAM enzyme